MEKDKHLNVFWQYNGNPHYEDNITKALVNTIDSYDLNTKLKVIKDLFDVDLSGKNIALEFYLQSKPSDEIIDSVDIENKKLIAFSPTGKCWENLDYLSNDESMAKKSIKESLMKFIDNKDKLNKEVDAYFKKTNSIIDGKGDSIPDGWIIAKDGDKVVYIIAFENKLYDLDPYQLKNHCDKSLKTSIDNIKFLKYENIINSISKEDDYMSRQFTEYMFLLGYWEISNLRDLPKGYSTEQTKYLIDKRVIQVLNELSNKGNANKHGNWMWKIDTENKFCKMIGLKYNENRNNIGLNIYFFSTQSSAKEYYRDVYTKSNVELDNSNFFYNFHFQHLGGIGNIEKTYYHSNNPDSDEYIKINFDLKKHMNFWYDNINLLKQSTSEDCLVLIEEMKKENVINHNHYILLNSYLENHKKSVNVVPEIGCIISVPIDEAIKLDDNSELVGYLKERIVEVFNVFSFNTDFLK